MRVISAISAIALGASTVFGKEMAKDEVRGAGKILVQLISVYTC